MSEAKGFWVIGDIHGMYDPLAKIIEQIFMLRYRMLFDKIIFIGDYIDHGPSSKQVIDLILELKQLGDFEVITLAGNHEDLLLSFLYELGSYKDYPNGWFYNGALATLSSFFGFREDFKDYIADIVNLERGRDDKAQARIREYIFENLDKKYLDFFENLVYAHKEELEIYGRKHTFAFLHAGYMPPKGYHFGDEVVVTEEQIEEQLKPRKFREFTEFWESKKIYVEYNNVWIRNWPKVKVGNYILIHGHDPVFRQVKDERLQLRPQIVIKEGGARDYIDMIRINVDTGAVYGKSLSAVHIGVSKDFDGYTYYSLDYTYVEVARGYRYRDNVETEYNVF